MAFNFVFDLNRIDVFKYIHNFSFELYLVNEPTFVKDSYFKFWATFELVILAHSKQSGLTIWVEMNYVTLT